MTTRSVEHQGPLPKAEIERMLRNGPVGSVALHGTCTEAVLELFRTSRILRSDEDILEKGRTYMVPLNTDLRMRGYAHSSFAEEIKERADPESVAFGIGRPITIDDFVVGPRAGMEVAIGYATLAEADFRYRKILRELGIDYEILRPTNSSEWARASSPNDIKIPPNFTIPPETKKEMQELIFLLAADLSHLGNLGAVVALGQAVFELKPKPDPEIPAGIFVETPSGLSAKYVTGVVLLDDKGKTSVEQYLQTQ